MTKKAFELVGEECDAMNKEKSIDQIKQEKRKIMEAKRLAVERRQRNEERKTKPSTRPSNIVIIKKPFVLSSITYTFLYFEGQRKNEREERRRRAQLKSLSNQIKRMRDSLNTLTDCKNQNDRSLTEGSSCVSLVRANGLLAVVSLPIRRISTLVGHITH